MAKFERIVQTRPPFDRRHTDPKKNYGVGAMDIWFILKGKKGATQFMMSTGSFLPNVIKEWIVKEHIVYKFNNEPVYGIPKPWDIGYHSKKPMFEGHTSMKCELLPGGKCYYDGSSLQAEKPYEVYLKDGDEGLWKYLEEEYYYRFGKGGFQWLKSILMGFISKKCCSKTTAS